MQCVFYLTKQLNVQEPSDPITPAKGIPINDVATTVPEDAILAILNKKLAQKKTLKIGFDEQKKLIAAGPEVQVLSVRIPVSRMTGMLLFIRVVDVAS